ncbi:MAG: hypothetical protein QOI67_943, partial [Gaiellaceae bacterium]|nr:hypothetical protein [Gaiellaceae bacterium]
LVLPILLLLVIGVMDVGKAFRYWLDETHLANQGARWVAVNRSLSPNLGDYLRDQAVNKELHDDSCVTLEYIDMNGNGLKKDVGDAVKVEMKIPFTWTSMISKLGIAEPVILASATMRLEAIPSNHATEQSWGSCA